MVAIISIQSRRAVRDVARVRAAKAKSGDSVALGVARVAVYADTLGGAAESDSTSIWSGPMKELPSDEKLRASAEVLAHTPFQMRAMHRLLSPLYQGRPMQLTKRELADGFAHNGSEFDKFVQFVKGAFIIGVGNAIDGLVEQKGVGSGNVRHRLRNSAAVGCFPAPITEVRPRNGAF